MKYIDRNDKIMKWCILRRPAAAGAVANGS